MRDQIHHFSTLLGLLAVMTAAHSPRSTAIIEQGISTGVSPKPTPQALFGSLPINNLFERQAEGQTCAFYSNGAAANCNPGMICVTNSVDNAAGCCSSSELSYCTLATTCYNNDALYICSESAGCMENPYISKCTDTNYPWCLAKIWNYATPATEWDCATVNELITLEPNYNLIATTSAEATTSTIVSITNLPQTTTITTSQPPPSSPAAAAPSSAASSAPSGNGDGDSNNGNGNSQNDGNTYQGPVTINNGKSAAGPSTFGTLVQAIQLMLGLGFPVLLLLT